MIPTLFIVTVIVFCTARFIPGDVVELMVAQAGQMGSTAEQGATMEAMRHKLGMDVPIHIQYGRWMWGMLVHGDVGKSLWNGQPVLQTIKQRLPVSFELGFLGLLVGLVIALPIGVYSAVRQDTMGDYLGRSFAIACIALPSFWLGTMVVVFPSVWWNWTPPMQLIPFTQNPIENLKQFILPAFIMGMVMSGTAMRMMRTMMLEVLRQDYIRTAWAKGLRERTVVYRHALQNALIPVVTVVGLQLPVMISGSIVMEQIFNLPGVGILEIQALNSRDYPVVSGINLLMGTVMLLSILATDLTYGLLDPRIRYE